MRFKQKLSTHESLTDPHVDLLDPESLQALISEFEYTSEQVNMLNKTLYAINHKILQELLNNQKEIETYDTKGMLGLLESLFEMVLKMDRLLNLNREAIRQFYARNSTEFHKQ